MEYKFKNILKGALIYAIGDTIASLLLGQFNVYRLLGMILIGSTVYAFEIPNYFNWIAKITNQYTGLKLSFYKTGLAILYFNPLWIARHYLFIELATHPTLLFEFTNLWNLILNLI